MAFTTQTTSLLSAARALQTKEIRQSKPCSKLSSYWQAIVGPSFKVQDHADAIFNSALVDYPRRELLWLACSYQEASSQVGDPLWTEYLRR